MNRKLFYQIVSWGIAIGACVFLVYKLATYDAYPALWATLRAMTWLQWLAIAVCVALMPLNMTLEAWRWKTLVNDGINELGGEGISWREAHRQVYYSKLAGLITPWRLGEYPARAMLMEPNTDPSLKGREEKNVWAKVLSMGVVGSATMTAAIVIAGAVGLAFSPTVFAYLGGSYLYSLMAVAAILCGLFLLMPKALKNYVTVNSDLLIRSTAQSLVRLLCWCVQLWLVLYALDTISHFPFSIFHFPFSISHFPFSIFHLFIYYLLVTVTPNVPVAEVGVRGAWAMVLFGTVNAALAGVLLWVINTMLPCIIGLFLRKNEK